MMEQSENSQPQWHEVLRSLRDTAGVTQRVWADRLAVSRTTLQRWERGETVPNEEEQEKVITLCRESIRIRTFPSGPLQGLTITDDFDFLRELLQETRGDLGRRNRGYEVESSEAEPQSLELLSNPISTSSRPSWLGWLDRRWAMAKTMGSRKTPLIVGSISALAIILVPVITALVFLDSSGPAKNVAGSGGGAPSLMPIASRSTGASIAIGDRVAVTAAGDGLDVHSSPSTDTPKEDPDGIPKGYEGEITNGPRLSNEREWWEIKWVTGVTGWSAAASTSGTAWLQPLPGKGVFPGVSDVGLSYRIQVYEDVEPNGLAMRNGPGSDQRIKARKHAGAQGWTIGAPKVIRGEDVVWWKVKWDDGTSGWSEDSALSAPGGVHLISQYAVGQEKVTLNLYVRERNKYDPVVPGAQVTGLDAAGESFNLTANSEGLVTINGVPGIWSFRISASGFEDACWTSDITSTKTQQAFFLKEARCR